MRKIMNEEKKEEKDEISELHYKILYPVCRVRAKQAGGSGTVIYSKQDADEKWQTFVLTNYHVVAKNIEILKEWDARKLKHVHKEIKDTVIIESFLYNNFSDYIGANAIEGDIVVYNVNEDLALIHLREHEKKMPYVAKLYSGKEKDIRIFESVTAVGATLGHSPIATTGEIMCKSDEISGRKYLMSNALTCFGSSGGALYLDKTKELIGIPSLITVAGWTPITYMGYAVGIQRIKDFFDEQSYQFLYDKNYTIEECKKIREEKHKKAEQKLDMILSD